MGGFFICTGLYTTLNGRFIFIKTIGSSYSVRYNHLCKTHQSFNRYSYG
jgi:hypothetical protein